MDIIFDYMNHIGCRLHIVNSNDKIKICTPECIFNYKLS